MTWVAPIRVEVVPDDDDRADPRVPTEVLRGLGTGNLLINDAGTLLYVRSSTWERMKKFFPPAKRD